jgi:hypothetical protein
MQTGRQYQHFRLDIEKSFIPYKKGEQNTAFMQS